MSKITAIDILGLPSLTMKNGAGMEKVDISQNRQVIVDGILCDVVKEPLQPCRDCKIAFNGCRIKTKNFYCGDFNLIPVFSEKSDGCT